MTEIRIPRRIGADVPTALKLVDERYRRYKRTGSSLLGLTTGFANLDARTLGLQPAHLTYIAARPSMGKTALINQMKVVQAKAGKKILDISMEMLRTDLLLRMLSTESGVNYRDIQTGQRWDQHAKTVIEAAEKIEGLPIYTDDKCRQLQMVSRIARKMKEEIGLDIIYGDHLQLAEPTDSYNREGEVATMSRTLKALAQELEVPVVWVCQLNREVEKRTLPRPRLSDLRESGSLEQDGDEIWLLYRPELYRMQWGEQCEEAEKGLCEVIVAKQRNGPIGTERLYFASETQTFSEMHGKTWGET